MAEIPDITPPMEDLVPPTLAQLPDELLESEDESGVMSLAQAKARHEQ